MDVLKIFLLFLCFTVDIVRVSEHNKAIVSTQGRNNSKESFKMTIFTITEKQNLQSIRQGDTVELKSLTAAKRYATQNQCFGGTVLTIEVNGSLVAYKKDGGRWKDADFYLESNYFAPFGFEEMSFFA